MSQRDFRVSVIITSYNQKDYLVEAVESVIHQTVPPYEIIIADDHSPDGSQEVIQDYMARYPEWIKGVFQKENVGIPKNRNTGLRQVTGDYVAILDGDDRFLPSKVEKELEALRNDSRARCVYSNWYWFGAEANGRRFKFPPRSEQPSGEIFSHIAQGGGLGLFRSMLVDYAALQEVGFLDERFPNYDDFDLTIRLAKRCRFRYLPEPLVEKREHATSYAKTVGPRDHLDHLEGIYKKMFPLLSDLPISEKKRVQRVWSQRFFSLQLWETCERGRKAEFYLTYLRGLAQGQVDLGQFGRLLSEKLRKIIPSKDKTTERINMPFSIF